MYVLSVFSFDGTVTRPLSNDTFPDSEEACDAFHAKARKHIKNPQICILLNLNREGGAALPVANKSTGAVHVELHEPYYEKLTSAVDPTR